MTPRKRGRPRGDRKANATMRLVSVRLTAEQSAKLDALPGLTVGEKIRRLLDQQ